MIGAAPEAVESALMRQHGLRRSPVIDALRGRITVRQLRVMVENLAPDPAIQSALAGSTWGDQPWMLHDLTTQLRALVAITFNINRPRGTAPLTLEPLPHPTPSVEESITEEQAAAEAELLALMHRKG